MKQTDPIENEIESQKESGLGALLKGEREKRGLSHEQVAQITRLRRHLLVALENEEWDNLPSSVYVKGFIKSYAQTLGLDEKKALELYDKIAPIDTSPPKPLVEPKETKKGRIVILIIVLGILGAIIFLGKGPPFHEWTSIFNPKGDLSENQGESGKGEQPPILKEDPPESLKEKGSSAPIPKPDSGLKEMDKLEVPLAEKEITGFPSDDETLMDSLTSEEELGTDWLVLQGIVKGRTWIRIIIDDQEPREYIFQPGSNPQWKARKSFDIYIGNAAGIEFDFNRKRIRNLGNLGQVIRLKLPEDLNISTSDE
jgi:cytoskeletal protein RodZ